MSLCLDCGLCCDGTLFHAVPITAEERARLGGRVELTDDAPTSAMMRQCCRALEGTRCTVYDERPSTCRTYRCFVLASYERGDLTAAEARGALDEVRALRRAVADAVGVADHPPDVVALERPEQQREAVRIARAQVQAGSANGEVVAALRELARAAVLMQLPPPAR